MLLLLLLLLIRNLVDEDSTKRKKAEIDLAFNVLIASSLDSSFSFIPDSIS